MIMKKSIYPGIVFCFLLCKAATAQAQSLTISGNLQVRTEGNIRLVLENMNVLNNGAGDFSGSTIVLTGADQVSLGGSGNWHVRSLVINKNSGMAFLDKPLLVNDSISLQKGVLNLNHQTVLLAPVATIEGENEENRIVGPDGGEIMITQSLNNPSSVNPGKLGAFITSAANMGAVTVKRGHKVHNNGSISRYYDIIPANNNALQATLRFYYLNAELNNQSESQLQLFTSTTGGSNWQAQNFTARNGTLNYVEKNNISSFYLHTLSSVSSPLPVFWGPVQAWCNTNSIEVKWQTLQEINSSHFIIQRSVNGASWNDIGQVQASGNSSTIQSYNFIDPLLSSNTAIQYRIQAVDIDGSKKYSPVVIVQTCTDPVLLKLAPVPAKTTTTLQLYSPANYRSIVSITGVDGRVYQQRAIEVRTGNNQFVLDVSRLASGTYYVLTEMPDKNRSVIKLIKE